jgi:pimeloyl-ACP methyl ester carboxylesterase
VEPETLRSSAQLYDRLALLAFRARRFSSQPVATSVGRVHVLTGEGAGRLPPLVLLHGLSSAGVHYLPLVRHLRPHVRRLVLPDMPAHGFSDVPADGGSARSAFAGLVEALDRTLDEPAVFYGNSLGGAAAIRYAALRPERVRGLFLASPGGAPLPSDGLARFLDTFRMDTHADALAFIDRVMARPSLLRHLFAWGVKRRFAHPGLQRLLSATTADELLRRDEVASLRVPVVVSWGRKDRVLPREHLDFFRASLPAHAVVVEPEHHGHSPYIEDAGGVGRSIVSFCRSAEAPALAAMASPGPAAHSRSSTKSIH